MSSRENRVSRLEAHSGSTIPHAVIIIPRAYSEDQKEEAIAELTRDLPEPFDTWVLDSNTDETHILAYFEVLDDLFDRIAKNPRRICDRNEEQEKCDEL